jgi:hypothetical protein
MGRKNEFIYDLRNNVVSIPDCVALNGAAIHE